MDIMSIFKKLNQAGIDTDYFIDRMKLMEIAADIIHYETVELTSLFKKAGIYERELKYELNKLADHATKYSNNFNNKFLKHHADAANIYGDLSDEIIEEALKIIKNAREL